MESKEEIRQRILRSAAKAWGLDESQMDLEAFDPLVALLVEAHSGEFARLERNLVESETRILERMLEQLSPEILTGPRPAHAIATGRSIRPVDTVSAMDQFYVSKDNGKEKVDIFFAPLDNYQIKNATIRFIEISGKSIFGITDNYAKERLLRETRHHVDAHNTIYLGIEVDPQVEELEGMRFFFNWLNAPNQEELLLLLRMAKWSVNEVPLSVEAGIRSHVEEEDKGEISSFLNKEYSRYERTKREVTETYNLNFVTVDSFELPYGKDLADCKKFYPEEFEDYYPIEKLAFFKNKLIWIKVKFPSQFSEETLSNTVCSINAFPIVNYRHNRKKGNLRELVNIIPLPTEEHYFDVLRVENPQGERYHEIPLTNIRDYNAGQYSIRWRDMGKLDKRAASRALLNLLDAIRDESSAFSAYGLDTLNTKITKLNQNIKELEQLVASHHQSSGHLAFVIAKPKKGDYSLAVNYLSSAGEEANGVLSETKLELRRSGRINRKSVFTLTTSRGGARPMGSQDRKYAYKKAIVSRGRVVSREDIKAFCLAHFTGEVEGVLIKKGYSTGLGPWQGLMRTIEVELKFGPRLIEEQEELGLSLKIINLERELNANAATVLPIKVISKDIRLYADPLNDLQ